MSSSFSLYPIYLSRLYLLLVCPLHPSFSLYHIYLSRLSLLWVSLPSFLLYLSYIYLSRLSLLLVCPLRSFFSIYHIYLSRLSLLLWCPKRRSFSELSYISESLTSFLSIWINYRSCKGMQFVNSLLASVFSVSSSFPTVSTTGVGYYTNSIKTTFYFSFNC